MLHSGKPKDLRCTASTANFKCCVGLLHLAVEWGQIEQSSEDQNAGRGAAQGICPPPRKRKRYLAAAPAPLESVAADSHRYRLAPRRVLSAEVGIITWVNGRHGTLMVTHGKTAAARRVLPMTPGAGNSTKPLGGRWEAHRGPRVARSEQERAHGTVKPQETTLQGAEAIKGAPLCSLQPSPYIPHSPWRIGMRCLDTCPDCWAQLGRHFCAVRASIGGLGVRSGFAAEWAQFWAQRRKPTRQTRVRQVC